MMARNIESDLINCKTKMDRWKKDRQGYLNFTILFLVM